MSQPQSTQERPFNDSLYFLLPLSVFLCYLTVGIRLNGATAFGYGDVVEWHGHFRRIGCRSAYRSGLV